MNRKGWVEMKISEALIGKQVILNLSQDSHVLIHPSQHYSYRRDEKSK